MVLYDPDGSEAWDGEIRLVGYAQADLAADMAGDPLLPAVGWSWLTEALAQRGAGHTAVGGTVTQTTSTRFGDLHGPTSTTQLELRGSWTATVHRPGAPPAGLRRPALHRCRPASGGRGRSR